MVCKGDTVDGDAGVFGTKAALITEVLKSFPVAQSLSYQTLRALWCVSDCF